MFRNPRENISLPSSQRLDPSVGRPPSPSPPRTRRQLSAPKPTPMPAKTSATKVPAKTNSTPGKLCQATLIATNASRKPAPSPGGIRTKAKTNGNIIAFFQKQEELNSTVFVPEAKSLFRMAPAVPAQEEVLGLLGDDVRSLDAVNMEMEGEERFNENGGSSKRRKIGGEAVVQACSPPPPPPPGEELPKDGDEVEAIVEEVARADVLPLKKVGPFLEDSEDEEMQIVSEVRRPTHPYTPPSADEADVGTARAEVVDEPAADEGAGPSITNHRPPLRREATSVVDDEILEAYEAIEKEEDYDDEDFMEGEETDERRYLEKQRLFELAEGDFIEGDGGDEDAGGMPVENGTEAPPDANAPSCPICAISLGGISEADSSIHVNNCLDGKPSPLPAKTKLTAPPAAPPAAPVASTASKAPFQRKDRGARPGQASPFIFGAGPPKSSSAFSKIMANHSEDAAWATAAAAEKEARGKPHYQRTCPFYKIMPGFFIAVDAFRYGAVEGQRAYFLSHFHSDHYIGLTSGWSHGPIYCSKVTANLVKQQLRVAAKWVVALEFEKKTEVPNTEGVFVTMISANHCPGSSLFLFEKVIGKGKNPKTQRVLHCGDFRACRMHVEHPLLRPDVMDAVGKKVAQQKIDVCYLDTTYLNPKYAFPPQEQVIKACADMCVSLNKPIRDETDGWEKMKMDRTGEGMVKFVRRDTESSVKEEAEASEEAEDEEPLDMEIDPDQAQAEALAEQEALDEQEPAIKAEPVDDQDPPIKAEASISIPPPLKTEDSQDAMSILTSITKARHLRSRGRLLVVVGTYSIGKERICLGIARALNSLIYAPPSKQRICAALEDPELSSLLTTNPHEAQVHMTPLFEIRADTLDDYLKDYRGSFDRCVGFRPSGWNYRPPRTRFTESPAVSTVLHSSNWKSTYSMRELVPQRGSTKRASCFGVPYSEHSSFREMTMFCCSLRIDKIVPTVNVGSAVGRARMKVWCERWGVEKKKNGLFRVKDDEVW